MVSAPRSPDRHVTLPCVASAAWVMELRKTLQNREHSERAIEPPLRRPRAWESLTASTWRDYASGAAAKPDP